MLRENNTNIRSTSPPVVLSIAGSDSGGGAGIQADLKSFMTLGVHGVTAIAALTAQNTRGVNAIHRPPLRFLRAQLDALFDDFSIAAVKIGMLGTVAVIETVADVLEQRAASNIVLDPVLIASSGARLSQQRALSALRHRLLPLADVLTPNLPEAETLLGCRIEDEDGQAAAARDLLPQVRGGVLVKGGHMTGDTLVDLYLAADRSVHQWRHKRLALHAHGTGCSLSAAIASHLGHGATATVAVGHAIAFLQRALVSAYRPGDGDLHVLDHLAATKP